MNFNQDGMGYLGEVIVMYELAKRDVKCEKLQKMFDYDFLIENNCKVEVKTSTILTVKDGRRSSGPSRDLWQFTNPRKQWSKKSPGGRDRKCDYYVFVCLDNNKNPIKFYIIPNKLIGKISGISIPVNRKTGKDPYEKYIGRWDLIKDYPKSQHIDLGFGQICFKLETLGDELCLV